MPLDGVPANSSLSNDAWPPSTVTVFAAVRTRQPPSAHADRLNVNVIPKVDDSRSRGLSRRRRWCGHMYWWCSVGATSYVHRCGVRVRTGGREAMSSPQSGCTRVGATQPMIFSADETTDIGYESVPPITPRAAAVSRARSTGYRSTSAATITTLHRPRRTPPHRYGQLAAPRILASLRAG